MEHDRPPDDGRVARQRELRVLEHTDRGAGGIRDNVAEVTDVTVCRVGRAVCEAKGIVMAAGRDT